MPEWDTCRPGFSALFAAVLRATTVEAAGLIGEFVFGALWDMTKFFDYVPHAPLVRVAAAHAFPPVEFALALPMHAAPRRLVHDSCVSDPVFPTRTTLPGCGYAIPFVRLVLRSPVGEVIAAYPRVDHTVHVDDIGQMATETLREVLALLGGSHGPSCCTPRSSTPHHWEERDCF